MSGRALVFRYEAFGCLVVGAEGFSFVALVVFCELDSRNGNAVDPSSDKKFTAAPSIVATSLPSATLKMLKTNRGIDELLY